MALPPLHTTSYIDKGEASIIAICGVATHSTGSLGGGSFRLGRRGWEECLGWKLRSATWMSSGKWLRIQAPSSSREMRLNMLVMR
eukprot:scaffold848_cov133-Skeletonema_dohrnii-CCMP3373.AAC.1